MNTGMKGVQKYLDFDKLYKTFEYEFGESLPDNLKSYFEEYLMNTWKVFLQQSSLDDLAELMKSMGRDTVQFPFNYEEKLMNELDEDDVIDYDMENLISDCVTMLYYAREVEIAKYSQDDILIEGKIKRYNSAIKENEDVVSFNIAFISQ